jgi:hypothetical protein
LLDALYGADEVFAQFVDDARSDASRRFVDLYTCCAGTLERSRALAAAVRGESTLVLDDDGAEDVGAAALEHPVVFKRVPRLHEELPSAYFSPVLEAAGFAPPRR